MTIQSLCQTQKLRLEQTIEELRRKISSAPSGQLQCHRAGNGFKWYRKTTTGSPPNHKRTYIRKKNRTLAESLALKTYWKKQLLDAEQELRAINAYLKYHDSSPGRAFHLLNESDGFHELLAPLITNTEEEQQAWATAPFDSNPSHPETLCVKTVNGSLVRSKSEAIITHILSVHQIAFRYEAPFWTTDGYIYPDFTIRHPVTDETYLWEHFGMIDMPDYAQNAAHKLELYFQEGYYPGQNLILTFETATQPLDFQHVEEIVQRTFLE